MDGIEVNLRCGDTITVASMPAIGAYRYCPHCDGRRQVIGVPVINPVPVIWTTLGELQDLSKRIGDNYVYDCITWPEFNWQWQLACTMVDRKLADIREAFRQ